MIFLGLRLITPGRARSIVFRVRGAARGHPGVKIQRSVKFSGPGKRELHRGATVREGAQIYVAQGATLILEEGAYIGIRNLINVAVAVTIGAHSELSWDVQIMDTDFHDITRTDGTVSPKSSPVLIGEHVLIGSAAIILKGVTVGNGSVVAAGAVVTRDVPPQVVVAGNPARVVSEISGWR